MRTNTGEKIVSFIGKHQPVRAHDLINEFNLSAAAIHKQLKKLIESGVLRKTGQPPLVYYQLNNDLKPEKIAWSEKIKDFIDKNYLYVSPRGEILSGIKGFALWLKNTNQEKEAERLGERYLVVRSQANKGFNQNGWVEISGKMEATFARVWTDKLLCLDWYSLPEFGKTRLGQLVLHAKQAQSRELVKKLVGETKKRLGKIIKLYQIEAIGFVPHTIPRKLQFLKEFRRELKLSLPEIELTKVQAGEVLVAQKSLVKLEERVVNARETIMVVKNQGERKYKTVMIIDDAVGSGATLNETAKKIKEAKIAEKVIGFSLVGSYKGFEVIREV